MATTLETILKHGGNALRALRGKAAGWFRRTIKDILQGTKPGQPGQQSTPSKPAPGTPTQQPKRPGQPSPVPGGVPGAVPPPLHPRSMQQGTMIAYAYDPKWKKKLPYYDKFPLVIPLEVRADRFIGLNLHYVDPMTRLGFVRTLQAMANTVNPVTRARLGGDIVQTARAYGVYNPCIHMYLNSHVRSELKTIPPEDWEQVVLLPWAQFIGADERDVWSGAAERAERAARRARHAPPANHPRRPSRRH